MSKEMEDAVEGFRRAESALAAITDDARRIASTATEMEDSRAALAAAGEDLKVVAGALVGLATAHRELVAQLGSAAAALGQARPAELEVVEPAAHGDVVTAQDEETLAKLRRAEEALEQSAKIDDVVAAVAAMGERLSEALAEVAEGRAAAAAGQPALPAAADPEAAERVIGALDDVESRLVASQRRIYDLVFVESVAFLILSGLIAFLATR